MISAYTLWVLRMASIQRQARFRFFPLGISDFRIVKWPLVISREARLRKQQVIGSPIKRFFLYPNP